ISKDESPYRVFFIAWLTPFIFTLIGFHWIPTPIMEFGHMPAIVGILGLVAFSAVSNLHIPFAAVIWHRLNKNLSLSQGQSIFALALLISFLEKLNPQIFPWYFGYPWFYGE